MCNLTNDVPQAFDWDAAQQKSVRQLQEACLQDLCLLSFAELESIDNFNAIALGLEEVNVC